MAKRAADVRVGASAGGLYMPVPGKGELRKGGDAGFRAASKSLSSFGINAARACYRPAA